MTRNYGRAPRGQRVKEATPQGHWQTVTMLAVLTRRGQEAPMTIAEPTDRDIFRNAIEAFNSRKLHGEPGLITWMQQILRRG